MNKTHKFLLGLGVISITATAIALCKAKKDPVKQEKLTKKTWKCLKKFFCNIDHNGLLLEEPSTLAELAQKTGINLDVLESELPTTDIEVVDKLRCYLGDKSCILDTFYEEGTANFISNVKNYLVAKLLLIVS